MHPDKHTSLLDAEHGSHQRSLHSLRHRQIQCQPDDRLSAASQQQGIAEHIQFFQTVDDLQIVLVGLAEPHAGIQNDLLIRNACRFRQMDRVCQICRHILHEILIVRLFAVVHQTAGPAALCNDFRHVSVVFQSPDIVDEIRSRADPRLCHTAFVGVQGNGNVKICLHRLDHGYDSGNLLLVR